MRLLDAGASRLLVEAHVKAGALLTSQWGLLEQIVYRLLVKEVGDGEELHTLLAGAPLPRGAAGRKRDEGHLGIRERKT